ncbi:CATRA conflict system CASPASE/TPR repeat-associated protein [Streptomyces sp. NPDC005811]|uniref:CATRA conflict system CASPASE/TPR repeat-associated protein n=1 Tax=Streptomyces sp. NPDC005811 TaxID=3154565 RepID=UPI00340D9F23
MRAGPRERDLVVHVFYASARCTPGSPADDHLRAVWAACRDRFGMDAPALAGVPADPPADLAAVLSETGSAVRVLAAAEDSARSGDHQAVLYAVHEMVGVAVVLTCGGDRAWADADSAWRAAVPAVPQDAAVSGVLQAVRVYRGVSPHAPLVPADADDAVAVLRAELPAGAVAAVSGPVHRPLGDAGPALREIGADGHTAERRLLALAPDGGREPLDAWTWSDGTGRLVPLTRYLLHAAAVRHQEAVYAAARAPLATARTRVEQAVERMTALHPAVLGGTLPVGALVRASTELAWIQGGSAGLIDALGRIRVMRRGVEASTAAMAGVTGTGTGSLGEGDRVAAELLLAALDDTAAHLEVVRQRADEIARVTDGLVTQRLTGRRQQLLQVQGAVIGGVLMALTAVQAFGFQVPLPARLQAPVIVLLFGLAVALPGTVVRWSGADDPFARSTGVDRAGLAAAAAGTGWLAVAAGYQLAGHATRPLPALAAAVAAVVLTLLADRFRTRSRRRA